MRSIERRDGKNNTVPVRKTESRLPPHFQAADFGEAVVASDERCALLSFVTAPLAIGRENVYVLFVTDPVLAASARSFEWIFTESGGGSTTQATEHGEFAYSPQFTGGLNVVVRIIGAGNTEHARIEMLQDVGPLNVELEDLITSAINEPGPGVSNADVARELINDHNPYYQIVSLQSPEAGDGFQRLVFNMVFNGALQRTAPERKQHIEKLAASLNSQIGDFAELAAEGAGVCGIRLALLAMSLQHEPGNPNPLLPWTEMPERSDQRDFADERLRQSLAALNEGSRIDLFNVVRFPKTNITWCGRILETLRDRYFAGTNFNDVLTGMSGTRAQWILRHYEDGPLIRS